MIAYQGILALAGGSRIHPSFLQVFYRVPAEFTKDFGLKNGPAIEKFKPRIWDRKHFN